MHADCMSLLTIFPSYCVGRKCLNLIGKTFLESGSPTTERRGGARGGACSLEPKESVVQFLKKLQVIPSHYGRSKSTRQYLPADLNITKLYNFWKTERKMLGLPVLCRSSFAHI